MPVRIRLNGPDAYGTAEEPDLIEELTDVSAKRVLELGYGPGWMTRLLAEHYQAAPLLRDRFEDGEPTGEALRDAGILRRLVARLDAAELLGLTPEEVARIAAAGEAQGRRVWVSSSALKADPSPSALIARYRRARGAAPTPAIHYRRAPALRLPLAGAGLLAVRPRD